MAALAGVVFLVLALMAAAWNSSVQRNCPIDPVSVDLGPLPKAEGFWLPEFNLANLEKVYAGEGPEDLAIDKQGRIYTGVGDGWIKRILVDGTVENYTYVGGRPLGIALGPEEEVYVAGEGLGLLKISNEGVVHHLVDEADGTKIKYADGVVVAKDGTVYFTDASSRIEFMKDFILEFLEGKSTGRVLKYDPLTNITSVLLKDRPFPNGVALSENEEFLLICETTRSRVLRYWLKGEKEGTAEMFLDNLPSYPDNVRFSDGNFYIGTPGRRTVLSDWILRTPSIKCFLVHPAVIHLMDDSSQSATLIVVSPEGELLKKYEDPTAKVISLVTGGFKAGNYIYFSGLGGDFLGRLAL